jgi:hypothetical protein
MGSDDLHHKRKLAQAKSKERTRQAQRFLIVTEGTTELNYFADLRDCHRITNLIIEQSKGSDAGSIYDKACELGRNAHRERVAYTHIFCVFDLDTAQTTRAFDVIQKMHTTKHPFCPNMHAINTHPCFEVWYLLHFQYIEAPYAAKGSQSVGDCVEKQLNPIWQKEFNSPYSKTLSKTYTSLKNKREAGEKNAIQLLKSQQGTKNINPITNVHELVSFLENLSTKTQSAITFTRFEKAT